MYPSVTIAPGPRLCISDDSRPCRRPAVQYPSFFEERAVRRVQIFGLPVAEDPAAKGDDPAGAVADRKHQAVAEIVRGFPLGRSAPQPGLDQQRIGKFGVEGAPQRLAIIGGPAQTEASDCLRIEPASLQIFARAHPAGRPQPLLVESCGGLGRFEQGFLPLRPFPLLRRRLRDSQPRLARQLLDRLDEVEIVGPHGEPDHISMGAAAEAMEEGFVLDDVERRRLLVMKRAQSGKLAPAADQLDPPTDQSGKRNSTAQLVEKARRKRHLASPLRPSGREERRSGSAPHLGSISPSPRPSPPRAMASDLRHPSSRLTIAPARPRSMTPAWRSRNAAITFPKSFTVVAPVSSIAVLRRRFDLALVELTR